MMKTVRPPSSVGVVGRAHVAKPRFPACSDRRMGRLCRAVDPDDVMNLVGSVASHPGVHLFARSITAFTMIYCTLNWLHFKNSRMQKDEDNDV